MCWLWDGVIPSIGLCVTLVPCPGTAPVRIDDAVICQILSCVVFHHWFLWMPFPGCLQSWILLHATWHPPGVARQLFPDVFFEHGPMPLPHLLNLCVQVSRQGKGISSAAAQGVCVNLEIGIPLLVGYWSSLAADFNALLIFSAVTPAFSPFVQYEERKVFLVPPWRWRC